MAKNLLLRVVESHHRDVGRGIARIDTKAMQKLGLVSGDVAEIKGKSSAYAITWPSYPEDTGTKSLRIDGNIRSNAQASVDEKVKVRKTEAKEAKKIVVASTQEVRIIQGSEYLHRVLASQAVVKGQKIRVDVLGNPLAFTVTSTKPQGVVLVTPKTRIALREKPAKEAIPCITYEDVGGLGREIGLIREMVELPLKHPELFQKVGIDPPKGVLLHGPPGTGKTLIAKAVASETDANFIFISGPEIFAKYYGESEQRLRQVFEEAEANAPSIIFIDEIDSIAPKRGDMAGDRQVERRVVAQLLALMDGLKSRGEVIVIAATNKPNLLDDALRRPGRFDRELEIGIPDRLGRLEILQVHTRGMPLAAGVDIEQLASTTHGFVGADLASLCKEAAMHAIRNILPDFDIDEEIPPELLDRLKITAKDFYEALKNTEPSALREVFVEVPRVRWSDIGGLKVAKQELIETVEWPLKYPELFSEFNTKPPKGLLLFGPPGTGKTLLAKAVATESQANFISIKGPELFNKFVGESERAVREIFRKARQSSPCVIFLDEIDSVAPVRGEGSGSRVSERVVTQLLTELDGIEDLKDVVVIAATNRPDMLDRALLRPGRIDRMVFIPAPGKSERKKIFEIHLKKKPLADDVNIAGLAEATKGYVGADIGAVCREAVMLALRDYVKNAAKEKKIRRKHFAGALKRVRPTMTPEILEQCKRWRSIFAK